jgi:hypothetical protein
MRKNAPKFEGDRPRQRKKDVTDGPAFSEVQQIALMRSIIARFDLTSTLNSISIATICNRSSNPSTGGVGKPVRQLVDRMVACGYLRELEPQPHLYGQARRFEQGRVDLDEFKSQFAREIAEYERIRNADRVFQYAG